MKTRLNREFLVRHLFAFAVFAALGGWFGLDAFVRYPAADARELYVAIEKSEPKEGTDLEAFKSQKIATQRVFAFLTLLAALATGVHLAHVAAFSFEWDEEGFTCRGKRRAWSDVKNADLSRWATKNVLVISGDGFRTVLDAWHHTGVAEIAERFRSDAQDGKMV